MRVRNFGWFAFGVLVAVAGAVFAQGGGVPSRLSLRTLAVGNPLTGFSVDDVVGRRFWVQGSAGGAAEIISTGTTAEGYVGAGANEYYVGSSTADPVNFYYNNTLAFALTSATTLAGPSGVDMTPATGSFTASYATACTTTPTVTFDYAKNGNVVTLTIAAVSGFPCTADSTQFSDGSAYVPAAIRPTSTNVVSPVYAGYTDNGAAAWGEIQVNTDGTTFFNRCATLGAACGLWTGAANRSVAVGKTFTYMINNP